MPNSGQKRDGQAKAASLASISLHKNQLGDSDGALAFFYRASRRDRKKMLIEGMG
jgi:hypothetical protein